MVLYEEVVALVEEVEVAVRSQSLGAIDQLTLTIVEVVEI